MGYSFKHKESSKLAFYGKCWKKDLKLGIPDNNGYKRLFYAWLLALDTHIKWFLEKKDNMLKDKRKILTEGKHWPEDYVKTAFNAIKASPLGRQSWYTDNFIKQDV